MQIRINKGTKKWTKDYDQAKPHIKKPNSILFYEAILSLISDQRHTKHSHK